MVAKYGTGAYGVDVYSFGYTTFTGTVSFAPVLSGNLRKTRVFSGTLIAAITLKGNLNRAGVQLFSGELVADLGVAVPVLSVSRALAGTLAVNTVLSAEEFRNIVQRFTGNLVPAVVLSAEEFRNIVQRLSGNLSTDLALSGHFGRDRVYSGNIDVGFLFSGSLFSGPMWNEQPDPVNPWVPITVPHEIWTNVL